MSVAILFYTPSLPEQRCCTKQPAACFFFCFILYPWPPPPPPPHPLICPVMLHHFTPGSNSKSLKTHYEGRGNVFLHGLTCPLQWVGHTVLVSNKMLSPAPWSKNSGTMHTIYYNIQCIYYAYNNIGGRKTTLNSFFLYFRPRSNKNGFLFVATFRINLPAEMATDDL